MPFLFRKKPKSRDRVISQMTRMAEVGRRLAIYDRETGFLAPWYMALRVSEECGRSRRYSRPLSVLVVEVLPDGQGQVRSWLARSLRTTDLVCRHLDRYFVLLAETGEHGASALAMRLLKELPVAGISCAAFESDAERFMDLLSPISNQEAA